MTPLHKNILVRFDEHIDNPLIIPERYVVHEQQSWDDNETRMGVTTDRRLINPQTIDILSGEYEGERAFVYYGAYETAKHVDDRCIITDSHLLFLIEPIRMLEGIYLGEEVQVEGDRTESGIYRSTNTGGVDGLKVKLLHTPQHSCLSPGQTIITTDSAQYWLRYEGKKYIMVRERYIAGVVTEDGIDPYGDNLLVELLPESFPEIEQHNERIKKQIDFFKSYHMYYREEEFKLKELPKTAEVRVLKGNMKGEDILIYRNSGVKAGENKKIIGQDALLCVIGMAD